MAYSGTLVVYGQGRGVVVATGDATEIGRIGRLLAEVETLSDAAPAPDGGLRPWLTGGHPGLAAALASACWCTVFQRRRHVPGRRGPGGGRHPRGPARHHHHHAGHRRAAHGAAQRHHPAHAGGGDAGLGHRDLFGQDRHADPQRDDRAALVTAEASIEVSGTGYAPHGGFCRRRRGPGRRGLPALADIARAALLCNDAALRESGRRVEAGGRPDRGRAAHPGAQGRPRPAFRSRVAAARRRHSLRVRAPLHGHAAPRPRGHAFAYRQGRARAPAADVHHQRRRRGPAARPRLLAAPDRRCGGRPARAGPGLCRRWPGQGASSRFRRPRGWSHPAGLVGIIDPPREEAIARGGAPAAPPASASR
jgi:hypothetical protein